MKFASFRTPQGKATYGLVEDDRIVDLGFSRPNMPTMRQFIASNEFARRSIQSLGPDYPIEAVTFLPVIPDPGKIVCAGLNYREHVEEVGRAASEPGAVPADEHLADRAPTTDRQTEDIRPAGL